MDATGENPYIFVCIRSNKPLVLCIEVVKTTLDYLPIMQNLHRLSLRCLIPDGTSLLCRARKPRSLMCPRRMCQSLVMSSIAKASPITTLLITLYEFAIHSALRTAMEPLVTLKLHSCLSNCIPELPRLPREKVFPQVRNVSHVHPSVFAHVCQTSSCGYCLFQRSCMQYRSPLGLYLIQMAHMC